MFLIFRYASCQRVYARLSYEIKRLGHDIGEVSGDGAGMGAVWVLCGCCVGAVWVLCGCDTVWQSGSVTV